MKKLTKKVLPVVLAGALVAGMAMPSMAATTDPWSIKDAETQKLTANIDGKDYKLTVYTDHYLKDTGALTDVVSGKMMGKDIAPMYPNGDEYENALVNVIIPENATANSPVLYMVDNGGWQSNVYSPYLFDTWEDACEKQGVKWEDVSSVKMSTADDLGALAVSEGYIVVTAGLRTRGIEGTDGYNHSPVTIADAKAVIRYLKYNDIGATDRYFINGTSGGGALSVAIASNGNSADFYEELAEIGAAGMTDAKTSTIDDSIFGVVAYCPITDLGHADGSYEFTFANTRDYFKDTLKIWEYQEFDRKAGAPKVDENGNPVMAVYQTVNDDTLAVSDDLGAWWTEYVNDLGIAGDNTYTLNADGKTATISGDLKDKMIELLEASYTDAFVNTFGKDEAKFAEAVKSHVTDEGEVSLAYVLGDETALSPTFATDWYAIEDGKVKIVDFEAFAAYVALGKELKNAPAFTNQGTTNEAMNENNLFGLDDEPYGFNNEIVYGLVDTETAWADYWAERGTLITRQAKMTNSIDYLLDDAGYSTSAPYWWVRHGTLDRDTSFANQTLLYFAMNADDTIKVADFEFAFNKPHTGDYALDDVKAFMASALKDAGASKDTSAKFPVVDSDKPATPTAPKTGNNMMPLFAVVVAAGAVALASTRKRVVR